MNGATINLIAIMAESHSAIIVTLVKVEVMAEAPDIAAIIRERALANGVDPATLLRIGQVESGLNPNSANPASSARGLFQFTRGTWGDYGRGADPIDPVASADAGARFLADNHRRLQAVGVDQPTPGMLYLAHFAGPAGAVKVMQSNPSASVESILGRNVVKANPFLNSMTAADLHAWAGRKIAGVASAPTVPAQVAAAPTAAAPFSLAPGATDGAAGPDPALMAALQQIPAMAQQDTMPAPQPLTIHFPTPPGLARARALARAMAHRGVA